MFDHSIARSTGQLLGGQERAGGEDEDEEKEDEEEEARREEERMKVEGSKKEEGRRTKQRLRLPKADTRGGPQLIYIWRRKFFQHLVSPIFPGSNSKKLKRGFRLPQHWFDSAQNLDFFKSVPGVCRNDNLQERGEQCKKQIEKNAKTMFA